MTAYYLLSIFFIGIVFYLAIIGAGKDEIALFLILAMIFRMDGQIQELRRNK
jgi:hypothetical protein